MAVDRLCDAGQYEMRRFVDIPQWIIYETTLLLSLFSHKKIQKFSGEGAQPPPQTPLPSAPSAPRLTRLRRVIDAFGVST